MLDLATAENATILPGADIPFSANGPINGITHVPGTTTITVPDLANYMIDYGIFFTTGLGAAIAIVVDGLPQSSTLLRALLDVGALSGRAMLTLDAGAVLTLRNFSVSPLVLDVTPSVGAQLNIIKLG